MGIVSFAKPPRNVPQGLDEGRGGDDGGGQGGAQHSHQGQQHSLMRIREKIEMMQQQVKVVSNVTL